MKPFDDIERGLEVRVSCPFRHLPTVGSLAPSLVHESMTLVIWPAEHCGLSGRNRGTLCPMPHIEPDLIENENRRVATQFVEEAISLFQQLDAVIGKPFLPDRPIVIQSGHTVYQDLLCRRRTLVLSPLSQWAVDLLLDGLRNRLQILSEPIETLGDDFDVRLYINHSA